MPNDIAKADSPLKYWLWLGALAGVDAKRARLLLDIYGNPYEIYRQPRESLARLDFLNERLIGLLLAPAARAGIEERIASLAEGGIQIVSMDDARYPALLKEIEDPPPVLFMRGTGVTAFSDRAIAVVGTRRPTAYGVTMAKRIAGGLAAYGFTIASGLAMGIDAAAHKAAMDAGAKTVAFLGCGVERAYPASNRQLMDEIIRSGAVYSEYLPGAIPYQQNFPRRNRLISGMSVAVVVIEAGERSGALITARFAGEQGRDVFAVPGNATSPLSAGANALLRDGAMIATSAEDIVFSLNSFIAAAPETVNKAAQAAAARAERERCLDALGESEKRIVRLLRSRGPMDIDAITASCGLAAAAAGSLLVMLEIKGFLLRNDGGLYEYAG